MDDFLVIPTNGGIFRSAILYSRGFANDFGRGCAIETTLNLRRQLTMVGHCRRSIELKAIGAGESIVAIPDTHFQLMMG
jgi:hypothetical protein